MHVNCVLFSSVHYILLLLIRMQCHLLQMQWPHVTGCLLGCGIVEANLAAGVNKVKIIQLCPVFGWVLACLHSESKAL
ncbi:MAG: hypothetical protein BYD32DRAFT_402457 [Podila humilis]|nr:MAG: hypothetical protein BYD32DRAFT_402457 [Podila humilis]